MTPDNETKKPQLLVTKIRKICRISVEKEKRFFSKGNGDRVTYVNTVEHNIRSKEKKVHLTC